MKNTAFFLWSFFAPIFLIASAAYLIKKSKPEGLRISVCICFLLSFNFLAQHFLSNNFISYIRSKKSRDYVCYEIAANCIVEGKNPYYSMTGYFYPPLLAQCLAITYKLLKYTYVSLGRTFGQPGGWNYVFLLYQFVQFLALNLAYFLNYKMLRRAGVESQLAAILIAVIFLINIPLTTTLWLNQTNIYLLDVTMAVLLFSDSYPWLAGLAMALGIHLKLYPALLVLPLLISKRRQTAAWAVAGTATIFLIQTNGGRNLSLWAEFLGFAKYFYASASSDNITLYNIYHKIVYNNSLYSFVYHLFHLVRINVPVGGVASVILVIIVLWILLRIKLREKSYKNLVASASAKELPRLDTSRFYGHFFDTLVLELFISPLAWNHHYILLIPVILWAFITSTDGKRLQVIMAAFLILALPNFDFFPFSHHYLAGLVLLVYSFPPTLESNPSIPYNRCFGLSPGRNFKGLR